MLFSLPLGEEGGAKSRCHSAKCMPEFARESLGLVTAGLGSLLQSFNPLNCYLVWASPDSPVRPSRPCLIPPPPRRPSSLLPPLLCHEAPATRDFLQLLSSAGRTPDPGPAVSRESVLALPVPSRVITLFHISEPQFTHL